MTDISNAIDDAETGRFAAGLFDDGRELFVTIDGYTGDDLADEDERPSVVVDIPGDEQPSLANHVPREGGNPESAPPNTAAEFARELFQF